MGRIYLQQHERCVRRRSPAGKIMSRALFVSLDEGQVVARCLAKNVGISAIERLPGGGVRRSATAPTAPER